MVNKRLPYEREPIPQDNNPAHFKPETVVSKIVFGASAGLGLFFLTLVVMGIWQSLKQFYNYLSGFF